MLKQLLRVLRRRWYLVTLVLVITAVVGGFVHSLPKTYEEDARLVLLSPQNNGLSTILAEASAGSNSFNDFSSTLVPTGLVLAAKLQDPTMANKMATAGATASYSFEVTNQYNQQYPRYDQPTMQAVVRSRDAASVATTMRVILSTATNELASLQQASGATAKNEITLRVLLEAGPYPADGRPARFAIGLLVNAIAWAIGLPLLADGMGRRRRLRHPQGRVAALA